MRLNLHLICGLLVLVYCLCVCTAQSTQSLSRHGEESNKPKLFRILDFGKFKELFRKNYKSWTEEMSRMRLFLASCFRAFVSSVKYKRGETSSYKSINQMSDWTDEEFAKTLMKPDVLRALKEGRTVEEVDATRIDNRSIVRAAEREAADIHNEEDVQRKMIELTRESNSSTRTDKSLEEVKQSSLKIRRKRESSTIREETDVADLMGGLVSKFDKLMGHGEACNKSRKVIGRVSEPDDEWSTWVESGDSSGDSSVMTRSKWRARTEGAQNGLLVDHRHCLPAPKDQNTCGSCYIFAAIAALEYHYCISTGRTTTFSEQFILDCGQQGCGGGLPKLVLDSSVERGLERSDAWPYFSRKKKCRLQEEDMATGKSGYWRLERLVKRHLELEEFDEAIASGPIIAYMDLGTDFREYGGGIDRPDCAAHDSTHCMLLVGEGREEGVDFWLFRNSHGAAWGEDGYYRVSKEAFAACYVHDEDGDNGWLIEGRAKFKRNPKYDHELVGKFTEQWRERLAEQQASGKRRRAKNSASRYK